MLSTKFSVGTGPGDTAFTRMFGANSTDSVWVSEFTAAFDAPYGPFFSCGPTADPDEMAAIVARSGLPSSVADRCRGWMGADSVGQVAERAVFAIVDDWSMDDVARTVTSTEIGDGWDCTVEVVGRVFDVRVESGRPVPTITCRADGGLPAKLGREYVVTALSER